MRRVERKDTVWIAAETIGVQSLRVNRVCMNVDVHGGCIHANSCMWRSEETSHVPLHLLPCLSRLFCFPLLPSVMADLLASRDSLSASRLAIGTLELQIYPTLSGFYRGLRILNSSPRARKARILPAEPSPQPLWILSLTAKHGWVGRS